MNSLIPLIQGASMRGIICLTAIIIIGAMAINKVDNPVAYTALASAIGGYFGNLFPGKSP